MAGLYWNIPCRVFSTTRLICGVVVAVTKDDPYWRELDITHPKLMTAPGGEERCHSVLNALALLRMQAGDEDWVLVHDAARPCLRRQILTIL